MKQIDYININEIQELEDFDASWNLSKFVSDKIDTSEGRAILIRVLEIWEFVNDETKEIWLSLLERAGFYPYFAEKMNDKMINPSLQAKIRTQYFKSEYLDNVYFHEQQKEIEIALHRKINVAVSAPTSFGKSLLIEEIVARKEYKNILVVQPTLALIDETRRKLKKYEDDYYIIVNTRQKPKNKNIFILTAERVLEFTDLPQIDFFVVDEFYKVSTRRKDSRLDALNVALMKIMNTKPQAMFLTPSVESLSEQFIDKYNVHFFKTNYALVNTNVIEIRNSNGKPYNSTSKKTKLFELLRELQEPSIIYVKSPYEAYKLANEYLDYVDKQKLVNYDLDIFEWMDNYVSEEWQLKRLLMNGIGAHNEALPRNIVTSEIDLFNEDKLKIMFATVSLIEGVNTIAKNVLVYSGNKGNEQIDFFDYANIRGRAGRMGRYYSGNVYLFNDELVPEKFIIDVPYVDQEEVSDEILFNIDNSLIVDKSRKENLESGLTDELKNIMRKNLISVQGQKDLYNFIVNNLETLGYLYWKHIPTYEQLWQTLHLAYSFLKGKKHEGYAQNKAIMALDLIKKPMKQVIKSQEDYYLKKEMKNSNMKESYLNKAIDDVMRFLRNDANFEIPKLLSVVQTIQEYVFRENGIDKSGDYALFSSMLENDRVSERFQYLIDFGIPTSAVKKLESIVPQELVTDADINEFFKKNQQIVKGLLLEYEFKLLLGSI